MTGASPASRARQAACLLLGAGITVVGLLAPHVAYVPTAAAAPAGAVMRPTTVNLRADEILTVDVLSNDDPPPGATWDRSSVCLVLVGGCLKTYDVDGFRWSVEAQGTLRHHQASRFGGVGGIEYQVRDSRGTAWRSRVDLSTGLTAQGSGTPPADGPRPRLKVTQAVSPTTFDHAGQVLTWTSLVTNFGDVPLPVKVTDDSFSVSVRTCAPVANLGTLAPGASTTCTATSTVRQDYLDGHNDRSDAVRVGATSTADGQRYRTSASATATSTAVQNPGLALTATASPTTVATEGQTVGYTFVARNRGNVTLRDLIVSAPFPGLSALVCAPVPLGGELAPAQTTTCRADRTVGRAQLGAPTLTDTAKATARTYTRAWNAASSVTLRTTAVPSVPGEPVPAPGPVARPDTVATRVSRPVVVAVLGNDSTGSPQVPLVGSSVRLRLTPDLPDPTLYGDAKTLVVPQGQPGPFTPAPGGGVFLVSGRGEITFVPIGPGPTPQLTVGYQVADANGATARSTLTVTVGR